MEIVAENRVGRRIHRHVRSLAKPRFVGSAGEYEARRYIVDEFQNAGYNVEERPFTASFFPLEILPRLIPAVVLILLVTGFIALPVAPFFSAEAGILVLLLLFLSSRWYRAAERMYRFRSFGTLRSTNILASHPENANLLTIVFTAHYDSKSQNWSGPVRTLLFGSLACAAVVTSLLLVIGAIVPLPRQLLFPAVLISTVLFLPCFATTSGNASPGAYDNASGVAILLELARSFSGESPAVNLHFIATGGEEAGLCGAVALVNDPSFRQLCPPGRTIIVNLDGIGSKGPIRITDRFGIPPVKTGPQLSRLCANIASRFGLDAKSTWVPLGAALDHIPFAVHGYEAVTLSTAGWDAPLRSIHTKNDTPDALDIASLEHCYAVCRELADAVGLFGTGD